MSEEYFAQLQEQLRQLEKANLQLLKEVKVIIDKKIAGMELGDEKKESKSKG